MAQQLKNAKRARELYHILGAPNIPTFKSMLQMNVIKNCPVTSDHVGIAEKIFGTDVATLKGKTTRRQSSKVLEDTVDVPEELYRLNAELELCIDGMYVNKHLFITSINKTMRYRCAISIPNRMEEKLIITLDKILRQYTNEWFTMTSS